MTSAADLDCDVRGINTAGTHLAILTPSLSCGGAEVIIVALAKAMRDEGWRVTVISMMPPTAFVAELERAGVEVLSLRMAPRSLNLTGIGCLFTYLRRLKPDVLHAHMFHANILARLLGSLTGVPVLCTIHNVLESSRRTSSAKLRELTYKLTDRACWGTTAISETVAKRYVRDRIVPSHRIRVVPNFVDTRLYQFNSVVREHVRALMRWEGKFVWLAVGRLEKAKDYPNLLDSFLTARRQMPSMCLAIVGEGSLRKEIESRTEELGLSGSVLMLGQRSDVAELMSSCDGFVLSSAWEGMPLVLLEAAACGRPVVTTDAGGAAEVVVSDRTGFVVPICDSRTLAEAMIRVAQMPEADRDVLGAEARRHVLANYSNISVTPAYRLLYEELLARGQISL